MNLSDSPSSSDDITSVIRMVKDYKRFVSKSSSKNDTGFNLDLFSPKKDTSSSDLFSSLNRTTSLDSSTRKRPLHNETSKLTHNERAEMLATKSKVVRLENELKQYEFEDKKKQIESETQRRLNSSKHAVDVEEADQLRRKFKQVLGDKESFASELEHWKNKYEALHGEFSQAKQTWSTEKTFLTDQLNECKSSFHDESINLKEKSQRQSMELMTYKSKLDEVDVQLRNFKSRYEEANRLCCDYSELKYRCQSSEQKVKALEERLSQRDETTLINDKCRKELSNYREMERQNKLLMDENQLLKDGEQNMLILEERLNNLKKKLQQSESTSQRLQKCQIENEVLKEKLQKIHQRPRSEGELTQMISELQKTNLNNTERNSELEVSVSILDATLLRKLDELKDVEQSKLQIESANSQLTEKHTKLQRRLTLVSGERDGLRRVLSSYEVEDGRAIKLKIEEAEHRINTLQKQYDELSDNHNKLREENYQLKLKATEHDASTMNISETIQLQESKKQLNELRKEMDQLREEKETVDMLLRKRELQGEFNPMKTRVLHLKNNLMQRAYDDYEQENEKIREENEKLRKKVMKLQQENEQTSFIDETMNMSKIIKTSKPMVEIQRLYEEEKKNNQRLLAGFKKKVKDFREAVYNIFGFSFKQMNDRDGFYRVQSVYSSRPDDFFLFTCAKNKEGVTEAGMAETEYAREWRPLFNDYIHKGDSIPAFLSAVTLDLFSQTTEVKDMTLAGKARQT